MASQTPVLTLNAAREKMVKSLSMLGNGMVLLFFSRSFDKAATDNGIITPLYMACQEGHADVVTRLINAR